MHAQYVFNVVFRVIKQNQKHKRICASSRREPGPITLNGENFLKMIVTVLKYFVVSSMAIFSYAAQLVKGKCCKETTLTMVDSSARL